MHYPISCISYPWGGSGHLNSMRPGQNSFQAIQIMFNNFFWLNIFHLFIAINLLHKSHNAPVPYPTMHHFVTEMCTCVHISVTKWCIVGYLTDALWDLWDGSISFGCFPEGLTNYRSISVQTMARWQIGIKSLPEPIMTEDYDTIAYYDININMISIGHSVFN